MFADELDDDQATKALTGELESDLAAILFMQAAAARSLSLSQTLPHDGLYRTAITETEPCRFTAEARSGSQDDKPSEAATDKILGNRRH